MEQLRQRIQKITEFQTLSDAQKISALKDIGIKSVPEPEDWHRKNYPNLNINCHAYAFGLGSSDQYRNIAWSDACQRLNKFFANFAFIEFVLSTTTLEEISAPLKGGLILYFDETGKPKHTGIILQATPSIKVRSKWGTIAIFEHEALSQAPANYGDIVKYYSPLDIVSAEKIFLDYVATIKSQTEVVA